MPDEAARDSASKNGPLKGDCDVKERTHYCLIAELFEYPAEDFPRKVREITDCVSNRYPEAAAALNRLLDLLPAPDVAAMQELFLRSFDVQAITTLDVGYVLFGDDYKRGKLLAHLSREHRTVENDCRKELADHLPNMLRLIGMHPDQALVEELVSEILAPALRAMIGEFSAERIQRKNESYKKHYKTIIDTPPVSREAVTLYQLALKALYAVFEQDFALTEASVPAATNDFFASLQRENQIEEKATAAHEG